MIAKEYSKKLKFQQIFQLTLITQFFNGITPFSSGGQPMEVYYLSKSGIKPAKGTNIILQNFIFFNMMNLHKKVAKKVKLQDALYILNELDEDKELLHLIKRKIREIDSEEN